MAKFKEEMCERCEGRGWLNFTDEQILKKDASGHATPDPLLWKRKCINCNGLGCHVFEQPTVATTAIGEKTGNDRKKFSYLSRVM